MEIEEACEAAGYRDGNLRDDNSASFLVVVPALLVFLSPTGAERKTAAVTLHPVGTGNRL